MKNPYVTYALLIANILVFALLAIKLESLNMDTGEDAMTILHWGSNINPLTLDGQPWRIFTSMFLHFGVWHLLVNMYALYSMGIGLEVRIGSVRFAMIYFICGVVANLFSLVLNVYANSAGASGALFGLYGYSLGAILNSTIGDPAARKRVMTGFVVFVLINGFIAVTTNVDVWGHVGGFVAGIVLAVIHFKFHRLISNTYLGVVLGLCCAVIFLLPRDQVRYYRLYQNVLRQERITNDHYRHELGDAELLDSLKVAVRAWDSIDHAFEGLGAVQTALQHDTAILRQYARLHRRVTDYRVSLLARQSYIYLDSIEITNAAFDSVPALHYNLDYYPRPAYGQKSARDTTQSSDLATRRVFYDEEWREINDPSSAQFYRLGQVDTLGRWQGAVRDYYRDGTIQMKGSYVDNLKDGVFLYYSDHNTYTSSGRYQREESIGKWENFHWNGRLQTETYYNSKTFVANIFDSLGNKQVDNGNGTVTSWYSDGQIEESGQYHNGVRTGDWFGYNEDGTPYYRELYRDNRLVQGASVDKLGKRYVYDELSLYAYPVKGMPDFERYVEKNIRRPYPKASGARIRVIFQVGRNGDMWDFVILEGYSPEYEQEAIRLIKEGPPWRPGLLHGHVPVPSQGYAVILF
ncbi:rhomboid family intramembrane serine protease [Chryseolinea sp. T2]|uniref:rhomboid family intramembrane serine protease n=1 Tax=Chryseolinea sp. T2 TaxID=3129255 RepID=UPI003076D30E